MAAGCGEAVFSAVLRKEPELSGGWCGEEMEQKVQTWENNYKGQHEEHKRTEADQPAKAKSDPTVAPHKCNNEPFKPTFRTFLSPF